MMEKLFRREDGTVQFQADIEINSAPSRIWHMITTTEGFSQWFPELEAGVAGDDKFLYFVMTEDEKIPMRIFERIEEKKLSYAWDNDDVTFLIEEKTPTTSILHFIETIQVVTDHTKRDLAGWHVCLKHLKAACEGEMLDELVEYDLLFQEYEKQLKNLSVAE